jgi:SpoVK/Ycf46/Vps4 family AAA+-type ATPase
MKTAERIAPCVLFIDELEKAFASGAGEDGGVSMRVLGTFLTWLQDRKQDVFVVATANDVSRLPPEFLRKGRFDETFFVDLPDAATRREITRIHLARRNQRAADFDLDRIADATAGFSGAEIEQAVVSALYTAFSDAGSLSTDHVIAEAAATRPLSVTMAERIDALREWAGERAVSAN